MKTSRIKFAILGNPIAHSLSPAMHNAAFKHLKLPYTYSKIKIASAQLKAFFKKLKHSNFQGLNITVPHKEAILPFIDSLSPPAKLIGAVNTLLIQDGQIQGYNTDGQGYVESLKKEKRWNPRNKKIVILGAGGAARAILVALCLAGAKKISIANRNALKAARFAQEFQKKFKKTKINSLPLQKENLRKVFEETELLLNTTSGGMHGNKLPPLPLETLPKNCLVSDIVYRPPLTPLLKKAKRLKLKTHAGLGMLLYQGALSFELWTGKKAPLKIMRRALKKALFL